MKKQFTLFLALTLSVGTMFAESGTCGENLTWHLTNGVLTISGTGSMNDFAYRGSPWYYFSSAFTSVVILNGVTSIGDNAFCGCGMTSVTIPNSVTSIGDKAFYDCGLTSVTIPNSVTSIGEEAFSHCMGLSSMTIPNSVTGIGKSVFASCIRLTFVTIPNSVTSIGEWAFYQCYSLISVKIPNSVISIGSSAFSHCTGLSSVTIGNGVTNIGDYAFWYCSSLTSITCLAKTPPTIGQYAFSDIGKNPKLYVSKQSIEAYSSEDVWKNFYPNIFPITADETTSTEVTATPTDDNSVVLSWPSVTNADTYTIEIHKNGELVCTLIFNAQGQLLTINFAMPARDGSPREAQTAIQTANGWQYTVNSLDPATNYTYTVTAKQGSSVLFTQSVEFHTNWFEPIDNVQSDNAQSTKVLRNGQLFIERNGRTYDAKGQEVK